MTNFKIFCYCSILTTAPFPKLTDSIKWIFVIVSIKYISNMLDKFIQCAMIKINWHAYIYYIYFNLVDKNGEFI